MGNLEDLQGTLRDLLYNLEFGKRIEKGDRKPIELKIG